MTTPTNNTSTPSCETCGSTKDCEEDEDNPGDYYCKSCWEEYSQGEDTGTKMAQQQDQQEHPPGGNAPTTTTKDGSYRSPSTSTLEIMTPRGLSLGTQEEESSTSLTTNPASQALTQQGGHSSSGTKEEDASTRLTNTPASQALTQQGGHSSMASTQDQKKGESEVSEKRKANFEGGEDVAINTRRNYYGNKRDEVTRRSEVIQDGNNGAKSLVEADKSCNTCYELGDRTDANHFPQDNAKEAMSLGGRHDNQKEAHLGPEYVHEADDDDDASFRTQENAESKDDVGGVYGLLTQASKDNESDTDDNDDDSVSTAKGRGNHHDGAEKTNDIYVGMAKNIIDKRKENQAPMISVVATAAGGDAQEKSMALSGLTEPSLSQHKIPRDRLPRFSTLGDRGSRSKAGKAVSPKSATPLEEKPCCSNIDDSPAYKGLTEEKDKEEEDVIRECAEEDAEMDNPPVDEEVTNESVSKVNAKEAELEKSVSISKLLGPLVNNIATPDPAHDTEEGDSGNMEIDVNNDDTAADAAALKPLENETQDQSSNEAGSTGNKNCSDERKKEASDDGDPPAKTTVEVSLDLNQEAKDLEVGNESEEKAQQARARPSLRMLPLSDYGIEDPMKHSRLRGTAQRLTIEGTAMAGVEAENEVTRSSTGQQNNGANNSASKEPGEPTPLADEAENEVAPKQPGESTPLEAKDFNEETEDDEDPLAKISAKEGSGRMGSEAENEATHLSAEQNQDCGKTAQMENKALPEEVLITTDNSSNNVNHPNTNAPSCKTCGSSKDCEEDEDNPGNYYCKSCWEEYSSTLGIIDQGEEQNQQEQPPGGNNTHSQERGREQQPANPACQALVQTQQRGYSSLVSTQDQKKGESEEMENEGEGPEVIGKGSDNGSDKRDEITSISKVIQDAKSLVESNKSHDNGDLGDLICKSNCMAKGAALRTPDGASDVESRGAALRTPDGAPDEESLVAALGIRDGAPDGESLGAALRIRDGVPDGESLGSVLGTANGAPDGESLGPALGTADGATDEKLLVAALGTLDEVPDEESLGAAPGTLGGAPDGESLGAAPGTPDGAPEAVTNANHAPQDNAKVAMAMGGDKLNRDNQKEGEAQGGSEENIESDGSEDDDKGEDDDDYASILGAESEGQHVEGTGDTFVTNASGSVGWSLYGGDTQMLPTGPSQLFAASSTNLTTHKQMDLKEETAGNEASKQKANNSGTKRESLLEDAEKKLGDNEATSGGSGGVFGDKANNGVREDSHIKETQKINKSEQVDETNEAVDAGGKNECIIEERDQVVYDHNRSMENMEHTPLNGSLPISYPTDHLDKPCKRPPLCDKTEEDDGDETTQSQDLLAASPAKPKQCDKLPQKPSHAAPEEIILKDPPGQPEAGMKSLPLSPERNFSKVRPQANNIQDDLPRNGRIAESCHPKDKVSGTKWMSTARHSHVNKANGNKDVINSDSSPRLLMPSFKPIRQNSDDADDDYDDEHVGKPAALKKDTADDGSENDSWSPEQGHNFNDSNSIDNTQDEHEAKQPISAFKRLSRGSSARSDRPQLKENVGDDSSCSKFSSPRPSVRKNKSNGGSGSTRVIKPKVLRYEASMSSGESESSSEAEFTDDDNASNVGNNFQQSQSEARIIEQIREAKAMSSKLPSAEQMNDIASRKQLSDEIAELKKSHAKALKKVKRENSMLVTQLQNAEETIKKKDEILKQKDQTIKQKKDLLDQQFAVIANLTEKVQGVANIQSLSASLSALPTKTHTAPLATSKRKKKNEKPHSDSNDDDDEMPLSALKNVKASSTSKKRRKSSGWQNKAPTKKDGRGSNCASSVETPPFSNRSRSRKPKNPSSFLSPELWKKLQQKGWKYQTGPEPHNKVYVPKDGATHPGTQLGIHFFDCDSVINAAIVCGDLAESSSEKTPTHEELVQAPKRSNSPAPKRGNSPTSSNGIEPVDASQESDAPVDDSKLCGNLKLLTLETATLAIDTVAKFVRDDDRFVGCFFDPLWKRLQNQGTQTEPGLNWRYTRLYGNLSTRSWGFAPPSSTVGAKGDLGKDYFVSEVEVALCVLKEVRTIKEVSHLLAIHAESFSLMLPVLQLAVNEHMDYKDAKLGKSSSVRSRRAKSSLQPGESCLEPGPKGKSPNKRQLSKITPEAKGSGPTKKQKAEQQSDEHTSPSFHMSQTQGVEVLPACSRRSPKQKGPLSGYSFFYSGIDPNFLIDEKIKRLGGKVVAYNSLTVQKASKQAFFLADCTSWRKMKYIYAAALGTPMLHYKWLVELEQKFQENGDARVFDHECFVKHRLPIGLDLSKGFYPMQSASNARSWDPPGYTKGEGNTVFHGMTIALAIDQPHEADWKMIIKACGATVKTLSDVQKSKGKINVDCCLFASTTLPPHVISRPAYVSKMLQFVADDTPLLDLAWVHQSIIQRKCLPLDGDGRYSILLGNEKNNTFSIKRSTGIRYEVGDLVQFSRGSKTVSHGRIVGIVLEQQRKRCKLEIQLLESHGRYGLVDCPSSAKIFVDDSSLKGNIFMMDTKDFPRIGYLPKDSEKSIIFNRVIAK